MTEEKFEYKDGVVIVYQDESNSGFCEKNGLICDWKCKAKNSTLHCSWKFNWGELKKKGIDRLCGYITVEPVLLDRYKYFAEQKIDVDLKEPIQTIKKGIRTQLGPYYLFKFEYHLIPHYAQIEEGENDYSSSVQIDAFSVVEENKNNTNGNVSSDSNELSLASEQNNAVLVIDGKKIHVIKWFLSYHSEFFRNLFVMDYKDKKVNEIPIGGISFNDFKLLLGPISSKPVFPNDETVEKLLELATRFKVSSVIDHCKYYLLHNSKLSNERMMWIGEKYGLSDLLEKSILEMDTMEKMKKWKQTPEYNQFSDSTKARVFDRLI